ncbi:family 16 glycoside hydrolase [Luteolibacter sp. Populi]|uniref:family 16 glycoside hydrolase n=1 Tax=Luteolibacter sp. Populi TaxID=3230487 RepID=UPI0034672BB6
MKILLPASGLLFALCFPANAQSEWKSLFNGKNLEGWTITIDKEKPGEDADKLVQIRDGAIHMYPDTDPETKVPFGVITHSGTFSRFHLALEYRWLEKRFSPRKAALRDAGLLYHASNTGKIWPPSVEYQIQEGDSGDIIFIEESGLSWMHPEPAMAPKGQGDAGLLPENGGFPRIAQSFTYFGRFPEYDHPTGWNRAEVIVHADESAEHILNGHVRSRLANIRHLTGGALKEGKICLQLEGAEIQYRDVQIRELDEPLRADRGVASLSAVLDQQARDQTVTVRNPLDRPLAAELSIDGVDAGAFTAHAEKMMLAAGESMHVHLRFRPTHGAGRYSAGLRIGSPESGAFVVLQGIGLAAFEGKNEPALQSIVHALGIPLDVGGKSLELDTNADSIGKGIAASAFVTAGTGKVRVTPLARFSPPGDTPFGFTLAGAMEVELGILTDSKELPDAHQCLFPPLKDGAAAVEFSPPASASFSLWMQGPKYTSSTIPGAAKGATIKHTGRVFPVSDFQGRVLENAWLVGFEEAANGDYQDGLFLIENVRPAP